MELIVLFTGEDLFTEVPVMEKPRAMEFSHFDWDQQNIRHLSGHQISTSEAEQVILNRPLDLESHLRNGEERTAQVGETDAGSILIVISTVRDSKIRVITAWPAKERLRRYFLTQKGNGNVGKIEEQDVRG